MYEFLDHRVEDVMTRKPVTVVAREDLLGALRRGVAGERPWTRRASARTSRAAKRGSSGRKRTHA